MVGLQEASAVADADPDADADADADADEDGVWETTDPKTKKTESSLNIYTCFCYLATVLSSQIYFL